MASYITEEEIEQALLSKLENDEFGYDVVRCSADPNRQEDLNDGTGRGSKKQCVLPIVLAESLRRLNPNVPLDKLDDVVHSLKADFSGADIRDKNYELYGRLRSGVTVNTRRNGAANFEIVRLIDFDEPANNTFTAVSQMWIQGRFGWRRPDVLLFVNGLPVVYIELKKSNIPVSQAYDKNLTDCTRDIPNLFAFNQLCVLSNGIETRVGAFSAPYGHFFEWLKTNEDERVDRSVFVRDKSSLKFFADALLHRDTLIDYIENFILFENKTTKIIAKNHQYIGVNNLMESMKRRGELKGRLGVFWHTQGSGKSYSMVMFARKVLRKLEGSFTFLCVTDREDLDTQLYKNFVRTEVIGDKEECQPKNSEQMRAYLQSSKPFVFTLIQKFRYDKGKQYPVLTERDDVIVMVDEAHRTQYKDLAENMRTALPNANFIAFTGTPLLGAKRLTNQWFGDYVSEYNFAQSVDDGSTVPLYYSRRLPEVWLNNDFLDDDVLEIIEQENLTEAEEQRLKNSKSCIIEVLKRDWRLETIAHDIAYHFPRRGYLGKGMVVSVDKFTTVKMYDKVRRFWEEEKKNLVIERNSAPTKEERDRITGILAYMDNVEMAVVISEEDDEVQKFAAQGLDIATHRAKMNMIVDGLDIEDRFKDEHNKLQLVFVCAMWLTGFDVKNLSTLYLDKPMKGHTLMQTIARANRVYPGKQCGEIIDYINVFKYMQKALADYAGGSDGADFPAKDIDKLIDLIDGTISMTDEFLNGIGVDLQALADESKNEAFGKLDSVIEAFNTIVQNDNNKDRFKVLTNTLINLHDAAKPEIFERRWYNPKYAPAVYLHKMLYCQVDDEKLERAKLKMGLLLDKSVTAGTAGNMDSEIYRGRVIDLSKIDVKQLRQEVKTAQYKAILIDDLREYIEKALRQMINNNYGRTSFAERYKGIIDGYNAGGSENEDYYEQLLQLLEDLKKESERAYDMGLSEEELEIFDLLTKGKKLTQAEEQKVLLSSKNLYKKLSDNRVRLFVVDWYKDEQPKAIVRKTIMDTLDSDLPESYGKEVFNIKTDMLLDHFIDMTVQNYGWVSGTA